MGRNDVLDILKEGKELISDFHKEFQTSRRSLFDFLTNTGLDNQQLERYKVLFRYYGDKFREEVYRNAESLGVLDNWYSKNGGGANIITAINTLEQKLDATSLVMTEIYGYSMDQGEFDLVQERMGEPPLDEELELDRLFEELEIECNAVMNWVDILLDDIKAFEETL